jgi:hypothetical protein
MPPKSVCATRESKTLQRLRNSGFGAHARRGSQKTSVRTYTYLHTYTFSSERNLYDITGYPRYVTYNHREAYQRDLLSDNTKKITTTHASDSCSVKSLCDRNHSLILTLPNET